MMIMKTATLSTIINSNIKKVLVEFCHKRGLKIRYLIEQALVEYLENEIDLEAYHARKNEETVILEELLSQIDKK